MNKAKLIYFGGWGVKFEKLILKMNDTYILLDKVKINNDYMLGGFTYMQ